MMQFRPYRGVAVALSLFISMTLVPVANAYLKSETLIQVGERVITGYDLDSEKARIIESFKGQDRQAPEGDSLTFMGVDELVKTHLVLSESERIGLKVSDSQLKATLDQIAAQNNINPQQLPDAVRAQGLNFGAFLNDLRDQIAINQMRERVVSRAGTATDEEIHQFLLSNPQLQAENARYSFWLATVQLTDSTTARRQELLEELNIYAQSFRDGVVPSSDEFIDVRKGEQIKATELPNQLVNMLSTLKEGEVSARFRTELGYHVVKLNSVENNESVLKQNRYSQIIFYKKNYPSEEKAQQAVTTAMNQLDNGIGFDVVTARYSDDPQARELFGDLGWMVPEQFPSSFGSDLATLSVGEYTKPVETSFSIHIIKMTDQRDLAEEDALRETARLQVINENQQRAFNEWVNDLKDRAYILVLDPKIGEFYP